jgi:hypothetical protein
LITTDTSSIQRIPRKPKPQTQPTTNNDVPSAAADSSPNEPVPIATGQVSIAPADSAVVLPSAASNSSPTGHDSYAPSEEEIAVLKKFAAVMQEDTSHLSQMQANALLEEKVKVWEAEDCNKTKKVLVQELFLTKEQNFICRHNALSMEKTRDRAIRNTKHWKEKYDNTMQDLKLIAAQHKKSKAELEKLQAEVEKTRAQNDSLRRKLHAAINKKATNAGRKKHAIEEDDVLLGLIENKAKTILWGCVKFIQDQEEEMEAAKYLVYHGDFADKYCPTKESKMEIAELYCEKIKRAIFSKRNYTTAEAKKYYVKMWKNDKPTLTVEDLRMCLARKVVTEDDMEKFMLYWEEYLPKQVGAQEWDKNTRYYTLISQAMRKDCKSHSLHLITPEDEAFLVLSVENGVQRWKEEFQKKAIPKPKVAVAAGAPEKKKVKEDFSGLFTSTTSGQNQYGGWSEEGLCLFKTYVDLNVTARQDENSVQLEKICLQKLREKWNIQMPTAEEQIKLINRQKSARKRGREEVIQPTMKKVVRTMRKVVYSDDEETEDED